MHEEIGADYTDMIYAATPEDIAMRRKGFIRKWRLKHRAVADSLDEAGDRLFSVCTFAADPMAQRADDECDRTAARGVQAPDQNADRAAISGDCRHVSGPACLRPDQHAQGRRMADACHDDHRSAN